MKDKKYNVAVVGATGVVGEVIVSLLHEREFPVGEFHALASEQSAGKKVMCGSKPIVVKDITNFDFSGVDYAFFSAGNSVSKEYVAKATSAGALVIDNSSEFRYESDIPLIVPEVNPHLLVDLPKRKIISNPNCSTIQMAVVLNPLIETIGVERVNVSTYQAVSGAGRSAIEELARQTATLMNGQEIEVKSLPQQIAFNIIPYIDDFQDNGYTREEMKLVLETQKIFNDSSLQVNATAVRVPVFYGHSESLQIDLSREADVDEVKELFNATLGLTLLEDEYPMPAVHAAEQDEVFVGRVRKDLFNPNTINLWVVADNVRKGAALNAVQIAELLVNRDRILH
jgi:aspartate-semialdehyde dehydrogenase